MSRAKASRSRARRCFERRQSYLLGRQQQRAQGVAVGLHHLCPTHYGVFEQMAAQLAGLGQGIDAEHGEAAVGFGRLLPYECRLLIVFLQDEPFGLEAVVEYLVVVAEKAGKEEHDDHGEHVDPHLAREQAGVVLTGLVGLELLAHPCKGYEGKQEQRGNPSPVEGDVPVGGDIGEDGEQQDGGEIGKGVAALVETGDAIDGILDEPEQGKDDDAADDAVVAGLTSRQHVLEIVEGVCLVVEQEADGKCKESNSTHHFHGDGAIAQGCFFQFFLRTTALRAGMYNLSHSLWSST